MVAWESMRTPVHWESVRVMQRKADFISEDIVVLRVTADTAEIFLRFLLLLSCFRALWMFSLPSRLAEASQEQKWGVQPAEHHGSTSESQALVIMLWIINAAERQRAAARLSDSGPGWSCTHILNIYSPVQLCLLWKSTKHVPTQRLYVVYSVWVAEQRNDN